MSRQGTAAEAERDRYFRFHLGITTLAGLILIAVLSAPRDATGVDCPGRADPQRHVAEQHPPCAR